jgi:hypothetical protein
MPASQRNLEKKQKVRGGINRERGRREGGRERGGGGKRRYLKSWEGVIENKEAILVARGSQSSQRKGEKTGKEHALRKRES